MQKIYNRLKILLLLLALVGCQKEDLLTELETNSDALRVEQAQAWYTANASTPSIGTAAAKKKKQFPPFNAQWGKAAETEDKRYFVVEVPIKAEKRLAFKIKGTDVAPNGVTRLLVLKDKKNGKLVAALMHAYSTTGSDIKSFSYKSRPKDFSGLVFYTSLQGELVNGYTYEKGKIIAALKQPAQESSARTSCSDFGYVEIWERTCTVNLEGPDYCGEPYYVGRESVPYCQTFQPESLDPAFDLGGGGGGYQEPDKIVEDVYAPTEEELENATYEKPFALLPDVPCDIVQQWVTLAKFTVTLAQKQKVEGIVSQISVYAPTPTSGYGVPVTINYLSKVLDIDNAFSSVVNMDYFGVKVNTLPVINGQQLTPQQFLNLIRLNINNFVDSENSEFTPYNHYNIDDRALWSSTNPLGAIVSIDIFGPRNGSVIVSNYTSNSWTFSTLKDPFNGVHPVSGNRQFGYSTNSDGSYTFYTRGVDRLSDIWITASQPTATIGIPFSQADALWTSFQDKIKLYVNNNGGSASANSITEKYRPDWSALKAVVDGKKPLSSLSNDCK
ncbi:hypothetical protein [Rufibacter sp. LB8]|uniref:hypothetical protein n=1 Tax=Rufibacter sp. LB8 TaxID=2777781 RepID=UPI00178C8038|nr:hypothetical protein [Rufibacter sp. LB8]